MKAQNYLTLVIKKESLAEKLFSVVLRLEEPDEIAPLPGQFMSIQVAENARRSYSLANLPSEKQTLQTYVDTTPGGVGSQFFDNLKVGDPVSVLAPLGQFAYKSGNEPVHFFATGTGIVPFLSMIRYELGQLKSGRDIYLHQGARVDSHLIEFALWQSLAKQHPNFHYRPCLSGECDTWEGLRGRVSQDISMVEKESDVYICGKSEIVMDLRNQLLAQGHEANRIFYERF